MTNKLIFYIYKCNLLDMNKEDSYFILSKIHQVKIQEGTF